MDDTASEAATVARTKGGVACDDGAKMSTREFVCGHWWCGSERLCGFLAPGHSWRTGRGS
jgi:hypothetical protein